MRRMTASPDPDTPPNARKRPTRGVTMEAVGRMAGVSQVTVSRALSDPSKVSPETLRKIQQAIEATGFVPNAIAGALASRKSQLISALVPSITNIVYSAALKTFSGVMRENGYQVLLSETGFAPADEEAMVTAHLSRRPDAMLLTGIHHSAKTRQMLLAAGIPIVEIWDMTETPIDLCVGFSHVESARAAADFVIDAGYRVAATVSAGDERALRRRAAFVRWFEAHGGAPVRQVDFADEASLEKGRIALTRLVDEGFRGVIFCSSDVLAHGVLTEVAARGLRVPEDIAVIGFGDQAFAAHTQPALTTVRVDRDELGRIAAQALLTRFNGHNTGQPVNDIGFQIIRRGSA